MLPTLITSNNILTQLPKYSSKKNYFFLLQAAIPNITKLTTGIKHNNANQFVIFIFSKVFHNHIVEKTISAISKYHPTKGIPNPNTKSIGHQGIFAVCDVIIKGPI